MKNVTLFKHRLSQSDIAEFFLSLCAFIETGVSILEALKVISSSQPKHKMTYEKIINSVQSGKSFAGSLHQEIAMSTMVYQMIKIGETRGMLRPMLHKAALYINKSRSLTSSLVGAFIYPCIISTGLIGLVVALMIYMMPQLLPMFSSMNVALPFSTRLLLWFYKLIAHHFIGLSIFGVCMCITISLCWKKSDTLKTIVERVLLRVPVVSGLFCSYIQQRTFYALSLLLESGLILPDALNSVAVIIQSITARHALIDISRRTRLGESFSHSMLTQGKFFGEKAIAMIRVGENTGTLIKVTARMAEDAERILEEKIKIFTKLVEPAIMTLLAVCVGFIAVSIISPMYSLTSHINAQ